MLSWQLCLMHQSYFKLGIKSSCQVKVCFMLPMGIIVVELVSTPAILHSFDSDQSCCYGHMTRFLAADSNIPTWFLSIRFCIYYTLIRGLITSVVSGARLLIVNLVCLGCTLISAQIKLVSRRKCLQQHVAQQLKLFSAEQAQLRSGLPALRGLLQQSVRPYLFHFFPALFGDFSC